MIGTDYHIHTHYVGCANETMTIPAILERCRALDRTSIAITDHCDTPDRLDKNRLIRDELERTDPGGLEIFFGCELNIQSLDADLALDADQLRAERFELVVAGVHGTWFEPGEASLGRIIERQTELMCRTAANPLVDVLVHPWWIPGSQFKGELAEQFTSLALVPDELTCRLVEVCREHNTAVELNAAALLAHPCTSPEFKQSYAPYIARVVELGADISLASDAHRLEHFDMILACERMLEDAGIPASQVWRPKGAARVTGSARAGQEGES